MPKAAPRPCVVCRVLVRDGSGRCEAHKVRAGTFGDRNSGTRQERGYGRAWELARRRVLERDCGLCQPCKRAGRLTVAQAVDHITPKARGGTDDESNLQAICDPCHQAKTQGEARAGCAS